MCSVLFYLNGKVPGYMYYCVFVVVLQTPVAVDC